MVADQGPTGKPDPIPGARALTLVWAGLTTLTIASSWIGGHHAVLGVTLSAVAVLGVAFVKARLVGFHFMEINGAPRALRIMFTAYCLVAFVVLLAFSLLA